MKPGDPEPALILDLPAPNPPPPLPGLIIQTVRDATQLRDFVATASTGFGTTPDPLAIWANMDLLDTPGLAFYLGFVDGKPVTTSCLYAIHGIGTVNMVSTIPSYRRRGLAQAMTWHAALAGAQQGCAASYLHASQMGLSLYQRMGYRPLVTYQTWTA
jgi:ribosomal protein S18 acetylase RimI-like enzyme